MGGYDGTQQLSSVERYNPATDSWEFCCPMPSPRRYFACAVLNRELYVMGGMNEADYIPSVERFDNLNNKWLSCPSLISCRRHCAAAFVQAPSDLQNLRQQTALSAADKKALEDSAAKQEQQRNGQAEMARAEAKQAVVAGVPVAARKAVDQIAQKAQERIRKQQQADRVSSSSAIQSAAAPPFSPDHMSESEEDEEETQTKTNSKKSRKGGNLLAAASGADVATPALTPPPPPPPTPPSQRSHRSKLGRSSSGDLQMPEGEGKLLFKEPGEGEPGENRRGSVISVDGGENDDDLLDWSARGQLGEGEEMVVKAESSFAHSMTQNFDTVRKQVESGIYTTKRIVAVVRKLCQLESEYSKKMQTVLEYEQFKLRNKIDDGMRLFVGQWTELISIFKDIARTHLVSSEDVLQNVARKLRDFNDDCERKRKLLLAYERKVSLAMQEAQLRVRKGQRSTASLIQETRKALRQLAAQEEEVKALEKGAPIHKQFITNLKLFGNQYKEKFKGSAEDMRQRGYLAAKEYERAIEDCHRRRQAAKEYERAIEDCNRRQQVYLREELPTVFSGMQSLELERLGRLKRHCGTLVDLKIMSEKERSLNFDKMAVVVADMDPALNITSFVEDWVYAHGPPVPIPPLEYGLDLRAEDIKAGRVSGNPDSVFHTTLERCMELQQSSGCELQLQYLAKFFISYHLYLYIYLQLQYLAKLFVSFPVENPTEVPHIVEVPRIVEVLISSIKLLGGLTTEGIFRISPDQGELLKLRQEVDSGNYDAVEQLTSPHLPAALLKAWLRDLEKPLLPEELYEQAIEVGKQRDRDEHEIAEMIKKITSALPPISLRVLEELATLSREIANEENCRENKMSLNNLGVVFAPGFLRNPSEDPIQLLQNAKYETAFTAQLLQFLNNDSFPSAPHSPSSPLHHAGPLVSSSKPRRSIITPFAKTVVTIAMPRAMVTDTYTAQCHPWSLTPRRSSIIAPFAKAV
eukprot:g4134.t1